MIYDCFIFFDEIDLLEIRLSLLNDVVDVFVIVESNRTFSGNSKAYNFKLSESRYSTWLHKIIYIPIEQTTAEFKFITDLQSLNLTDGAWQMEFQQRNALGKANSFIDDHDLVMLSDLDEIPNPSIIKRLHLSSEPKVLLQLFHYYYLNCQNVGYERLWKGTIICTGIVFKKSTPQSLRSERGKFGTVDNGGWHFSYLGGVEKIKYKIQSFAHTEYNKAEYLRDDKILKFITKGEDIFNRPGTFYKFFSIFFYPVTLRKIMLRYPQLIYYPKRGHLLSIIKYKIYKIFYRITWKA